MTVPTNADEVVHLSKKTKKAIVDALSLCFAAKNVFSALRAKRDKLLNYFGALVVKT